jgi:hypothetical protein
MRVAIGGKQLIVSLSSVGSECRLSAAESLAAFTDGQRRLARVHSMREFSHDRASRETAALLNGASRLRTP